MKLRRNAFFYFAVMVFLLCMLFAMACVFRRIGDGQEYPYFLKGAWLLGVLCLASVFLGLSALFSRLNLSARAGRFPLLARAVEWLLAALLLSLGFFLRLWVARSMPMQPDSDYKTYYEMACLLRQGTLLEAGIGYCDYVAMFPHVFGYPWVLSLVLGIFGESLYTALVFNLVLETASCLLVWRIARLVGGRISGMAALAAACFLPSGILYSNFVASEPLFTFVLLLGIWLFALSLKPSPAKDNHPWLCASELIALGLVLAFGSFVRPMAVIFLVAVVICLVTATRPYPTLPQNDIPLGLRLTDKGWKRCLVVCVVYFAFSSLFTLATGYAVNRQLAGSGSSYGYNLLVGLNLESYGGWNQQDADYLYDAFAATGSAQEAQLACRDLALERLNTDPRALLNLFVHKFDVLWGNDDFGASWNILFMDQQGNLTPERESFLYRMMDVSDLYYLTLLLGALLFGILSIRREPDALYGCLLLVCGTVALHLMVENQNRYHYHALPLLCIMSGVASGMTVTLVRRFIMERLIRKREAAAEKAAAEANVRKVLQEQEEQARLRAEALHAQFDMGKALAEGHIRIVATQAVQKTAELNGTPPSVPRADESPLSEDMAEEKKADLPAPPDEKKTKSKKESKHKKAAPEKEGTDNPPENPPRPGNPFQPDSSQTGESALPSAEGFPPASPARESEPPRPAEGPAPRPRSEEPVQPPLTAHPAPEASPAFSLSADSAAAPESSGVLPDSQPGVDEAAGIIGETDSHEAGKNTGDTRHKDKERGHAGKDKKEKSDGRDEPAKDARDQKSDRHDKPSKDKKDKKSEGHDKPSKDKKDKKSERHDEPVKGKKDKKPEKHDEPVKGKKDKKSERHDEPVKDKKDKKSEGRDHAGKKKGAEPEKEKRRKKDR